MRINKTIAFFVIFVVGSLSYFAYVRNKQYTALYPPSPTPRFYVQAKNDTMLLATPKMEETVDYRFTVRGTAKVKGTMMVLKVLDGKSETTYLDTTVYADVNKAGEFGDFTYIVDLTEIKKKFPQLKRGSSIRLELYEPYQAQNKEAVLVVPLTISE